MSGLRLARRISTPFLLLSAMGVLDTIMDIGQTLGPITLGLLIPAFYYYISFAIVGVVLLILALLFAVTVR